MLVVEIAAEGGEGGGAAHLLQTADARGEGAQLVPLISHSFSISSSSSPQKWDTVETFNMAVTQ
jgi:hypothetical protein